MTAIQNIFNLLPPFKGKLRLASSIFSKENEREFKTNRGIYFKVPNLTETVSFELFVNGVYEKETIEYICNSIPQNGVFIDVGANVGAICVEVAVARPDVLVYAFEASPRVFEYLAFNKMQNNLENLLVYNLAIHEFGGGELPFYSPIFANGKGSFSPVFTNDAELVNTIRLDDFLLTNGISPDFIKIDVEGYELLVFRSLSNFFDLNDTILLFEFVDWAEELANQKKGAAQDYLLDVGYTLKTLKTNRLITHSIKQGSEMIVARKI